jgi:hypothetical protein
MGNEPLETEKPHPERAVLAAAVEEILAGRDGADLDRVALLGAAHGIILFLLDTAREDDQKLIPDYASLSIKLTEFLDSIIQNVPDSDARLTLLRSIAKHQAAWPTLVRPGDPKFSEEKVRKLNVGAKSHIRHLEKGAKRPASLATTRNRLTADIVARLKRLANMIAAFHDDAQSPEILGNPPASADDAAVLAIQMEIQIDPTRAAQLLPILRAINQLPSGSPLLSKETGKRWKEWIIDFIIITDPDQTRYPELIKVKSWKAPMSIKRPEAKLRYNLDKFFNPARESLAAT